MSGKVESRIRGWPGPGFSLAWWCTRSPDAAWVNAERWRQRNPPGIRFPVFAPDFVIEVRPPGQRSRELREKMEEYVANGVLLAWLIDPVEPTVAIYRPGQVPQVLQILRMFPLSGQSRDSF